MPALPLTPEQMRVVTHPRGRHARVLAVAGSGKTTTMVARVAHLLREQNLNAGSICILMFNVRARQQFEDKLAEALPPHQRPKAMTFHSFAYSQIQRAIGYGLLPASSDFWVDDREEMVRRTVHAAINDLVRQGVIEPQSVDPEQALESIGLWKGSLIPHERAGHRTNGRLPLVYREFERLRTHKNAITYDDFVPLAVDLLDLEEVMARGVINHYDVVIVDEYQDVNYGQQRLIELIAGARADIMVVGDDDQTIYEWRGARPDYIIRDFPRVFSNKPTIDYTLSRSFRFGPVLAQSAQNVIAFNQVRVPKPIIAFHGHAPAQIHVLVDRSGQMSDVNKELATQLRALVRETRDPQNVVVLARMFAQLAGIEAEFLVQGIPYKVLGRPPFFERAEVAALLHYLRLGLALNTPLDRDTADQFERILNVPNRRLSREPVRTAIDQALGAGRTLRQLLDDLTHPLDSPFSRTSRDKMDDLADVLFGLHERLSQTPPPAADRLLMWLIKRTNFSSHNDNYYGAGEDSEERKLTIVEFIRYVSLLKLDGAALLAHIAALDTTLGQPPDQLVLMTTIFRVKGEEFDYVFIPHCTEGYMPCLYNTEHLIFDTKGEVSEPAVSSALESERRLFYVALTRARRAVFIGTSQPPGRGAQARSASPLPSRFLEEIQLEAVQAVMGLVQEILAGDTSKIPALLAALQRYAGSRPMMQNLLDAYTAEDRLRLDGRVAQLLLAAPETSFRYAVDYDAPTRPAAPVAKVEIRRAWFDE
jgi:DNA helicase-2/ATP-dependent DNA helicase PcrA